VRSERDLHVPMWSNSSPVWGGVSASSTPINRAADCSGICTLSPVLANGPDRPVSTVPPSDR
jgi:hypothetical protein